MADSIRLEASAQTDALSKEEWQQLLEAAEESGSLRRSTIAEILDQRELEPFVVPPARPSYRLTGTVLFADRVPASGVVVSLSDGATSWRQVASGIKTGSDGSFSFVVHEGLSYIATASYWDEVQGKTSGAILGPFVMTAETRPLQIVLSAPK